ncbi:MAG: hypothetical protein LBG87_07240 [Spirochaetaceae bacterium]|jgi:hypothetical protein|nr:hypothetical protein [Spirochaetaceae bacterium]
MKKTKKQFRFYAGMVCCAFALALAGCNSGDDDTKDEEVVPGMTGPKEIDGTDHRVKTAVYIEVNDENPLNAGAYQLEDGTVFFDYVILFAANIRERNCAANLADDHSCTKSGPHVHLNRNVQFILDNRNTYIKPLQDKGIKVLLGLLGDHDGISFGSISDEKITTFIMDVNQVVQNYGLDGVDFDDEWGSKEAWDTSSDADNQNPTPESVWVYPQSRWWWPIDATIYRDPTKGIEPGNGIKGVAPSAEAMDRMWKEQGAVVYNVIKAARTAMPDKTIAIYEYNTVRYITPGGNPNKIATMDNAGVITQSTTETFTKDDLSGLIDMGFNAMYNTYNAESYNGLPRAKYGPTSVDLSGRGYSQNGYFLPAVELTTGTTGNVTIGQSAEQFKAAGDYGVFLAYGLGKASDKKKQHAQDPESEGSMTVAEYLSLFSETVFGQKVVVDASGGNAEKTWYND